MHIIQAEDPWRAAYYVSTILSANQQVGQKLWKLCKENLADRLGHHERLSTGTFYIECIHSNSTDLSRELCDMLDLNDIVESVNKTKYPLTILDYIVAISDSNETVGRRLWELCKDDLATKLRWENSLFPIALHIADIQSKSPALASEVCVLLNVKELVVSINQAKDPWEDPPRRAGSPPGRARRRR